MSTDCVGVDTSKFEFTFDCETSPGERFRHSFGVGGFDDQEEFDTSIKCSKCIAPETAAAHKEAKPPVHMTGSSASATSEKAGRMDTRGTVAEETPMHVHFLTSAADAKKDEEEKEKASVVTYGPKDCVSTWRDGKSGHCQVKTNCTGVDTTQYMFGLICENDDGKVRHLFGKDSFDSEEEFDTLIPCKTCLALDNVTKATELEAENAELVTEVNALAAEVGTIKETYQGLEKDVGKLNTAVTEKEGGEKKEEKAEDKKEGEEEKKEGEGEKKEGEEKKEEGEEKKDEEKKDEEKKDDAKTAFYLTDRDVDENLPYDNIAKSHLKGRASRVKKQRSSQNKRRLRHQKSQDVEAEDDDDAEDDESAPPARHMSHKKEEKEEDNSDDSDDSSDDQNDD